MPISYLWIKVLDTQGNYIPVENVVSVAGNIEIVIDITAQQKRAADSRKQAALAHKKKSKSKKSAPAKSG